MSSEVMTPDQVKELVRSRIKTIYDHILQNMKSHSYVLIVTHPGLCPDPECKICNEFSISSEFEAEGFANYADMSKLLKGYAKFSGLKDTVFEYTDDLDKLVFNNSIYARWGVFQGSDAAWIKLSKPVLAATGLDSL